MREYNGNHPINIGTRRVVPIAELAKLIKDTVGYKGKLVFNTDRPDGMPKKLLNTSPLFKLGWRPQVELEGGIRLTYDWYCKQQA